MSQITELSSLVNGLPAQQLLTANELVVLQLRTGSTSGNLLTDTILGRTIALQDGTDVDTTYHTHNTVYYTQTQLGATSGTPGSTLIGDSASYTNFTPTAATVKGALSGIDAEISTILSDISNMAQGLSWKQVVRSATTTALPAYSYSNGSSGVGATLTGTTNAALTAQDGVTLVVNDRLLVKNETSTNQPYNGIYVLTQVGSGSLPYILTRSTDDDTAAYMIGATVEVGAEASTQAKYIYWQNSVSITMGTTNIIWQNISQGIAYSFGNGLQVIGANVTVEAADSSISVSSGGIAVVEDAAGAIITGGSGIKIQLQASNPSLAIVSNQLGVKLNASGAIVTGASGLSAQVDGSTLTINGSNQLAVASAGITSTQLASASVTIAKLATITDGVTLDQSGASSSLEIKSGGVGTTQLASQAVTSAKIATSALDQATITGGNGSTIAVQYAPAIEMVFVSGVTLTANTSYLVRMGIVSNSETAGRVYLADCSSASANGQFWAIGMASGGAGGVSIGGNVTVTMLGSWTLGSSDTAFSSGVVGEPVWLVTSGTFSTTAPTTAGYADFKVGIVSSTTTILIDSKQLTGVN